MYCGLYDTFTDPALYCPLKPMRVICDTAKRCNNGYIPEEWLDMIYTKASTYAKHLRHVRVHYKNSIGAIENNLR